ncbi:adenosine deaminase 2-like [Aphidius gifuensis]|nr:adenosine deaminase 2-like [Aphidius gifuensis]
MFTSLSNVIKLMVTMKLIILSSALPADNYWNNRAAILHEEEVLSLGGNLTFLPGERSANNILMTLKKKEIDEGFVKPSKFLASNNFIKAKNEIEKSDVFKIIKRMPKGAVLHSHDTAIVSVDWVYNVTFLDNLYVCDSNDKLLLHFFDEPKNDCDWKLLSDLRKNTELLGDLDERIFQKMTMVVDDPDMAYADVDTAWTKFMDVFIFIEPLLTYRPVYEAHYYEGLRQLHEDNVMYLELRSLLPTLYELDGTTYTPLELCEIYKNVTDKFKLDYPDFIGAKLIYAPLRFMSIDELKNAINETNKMKLKFPDFFAGFDLVGQEDKGIPLITYADELKKMSNDIEMYFHAGETNWYGASIDENLLDAVLLGAKRIGHGFAIVKHPKVLKMMREKNIAIEICPISNQVLGLVKDLRNHPANILFSEGYPVVVSNDDPGIWGGKALSYDFYEAFMSLMSRNADIRALKQLAMNSITYSSLNEDDKIKAMDLFNQKWLVFVDELNS